MDSVVPSYAQREPYSDLISLFTVVARKLSMQSFPVLWAQDHGESSLSSRLTLQLHLLLPLLFLHLLNFTLVCVCQSPLRAKLKSS